MTAPTIRFVKNAATGSVAWSCSCGGGHRNSSEGCAVTDAESHARDAHPAGSIVEYGGLW